MSVFGFVSLLLNAVVALPKIGAMVENLCGMVAHWWVSRQKSDALVAIADAAAAGARAKTQEERYAALEKWRIALSKPRPE